LADLVVAENLIDFLVEGGDPPIKVPEKIVEFSDCVTRHGCQLIVLIGQSRCKREVRSTPQINRDH
jgi:hypothetical protein